MNTARTYPMRGLIIGIAVVLAACGPATSSTDLLVIEAVDPPHRGLQTVWWEQVRVDDPATRPQTPVADPSTIESAGRSTEQHNTRTVTYEVPADVLFATDSAEITPAGRAEIDRLAPELKTAIDILVAGCTDPRGSDEHNLELSAGRSQSVIDTLVQKEIESTVLRWEAWADTRLTTRRPGQDETEWHAENRRVIIIATFETNEAQH